MCVAALGVVTALASTAVSFAAAQEDYENRSEQWRQNYTNALASGRDEQNAIQMRTVQEQESHAQKQQLTNIEGAEVAAEAEVSAAGAGVSGISVDNILRGVRRKIGMKLEADDVNHRNTVAQLGAEMKATDANIQNRINSVQRPTAPNPLGYALQGIGGALNAASSIKF